MAGRMPAQLAQSPVQSPTLGRLGVVMHTCEVEKLHTDLFSALGKFNKNLNEKEKETVDKLIKTGQ